MRYRRGLVTLAQEIAVEERRDLGLGPTDALDPWALAVAHGVEVIDICDLHAPNDAIQALTGDRAEMFSAALVPDGHGCFIIENGAHSVERRRANVAHEMAHVLLEHEFHNSLFTADCIGTTGPLEREADRPANELLLPNAAALRCARADLDDAAVARRAGISEARARMAMNMSGARKRVRRERALRSR